MDAGAVVPVLLVLPVVVAGANTVRVMSLTVTRTGATTAYMLTSSPTPAARRFELGDNGSPRGGFDLPTVSCTPAELPTPAVARPPTAPA
jgi:hypothetical protein